MFDIYQGDPYLTLGENGSRLHYIGGQPVMDQGIENLAFISLFTRPGWAGNIFFNDTNQRIGSDFVEAAKQPITLQSLTDVEQAAVRALDSPAFGRVTVTATNPASDRLVVNILIEPPGQIAMEIRLTRSGDVWVA